METTSQFSFWAPGERSMFTVPQFEANQALAPTYANPTGFTFSSRSWG
jgi:hypothetical protein